MILTSLDLYYLDQCPKRWKEENLSAGLDNPARELIKRVFLTKSIGRECNWTLDSIAGIWDEIYWRDKDINPFNIRESVNGILSARKIYKKIIKDPNIESYSTQNLISYLDTGVTLKSSGDLLFSYKDRYETWLFLPAAKKEEIRRSPLPAVEKFLLLSSIRGTYLKPFYLIIYSSDSKKKRPSIFYLRENNNIDYLRKIVFNLSSRAKKKIFFPSAGTYCKECKVNC